MWYNFPAGPAGKTTRKEKDHLEPTDVAHAVVDAIVDKQGSDVVLLDIRPVSLIADYFVIGTGETERQIKAILDAIGERLRTAGVYPVHIEGTPSSGWVILDYGSVVAHLFAPEMRDYYRLEHLWRNATLVVHIQ